MSKQEDIEKAGEVMFDSVYVPSFVKQCANRGATFNNEEELVTALNSVLMLKSAEATQAGTNGSMHKAANLALRQMFGENVEQITKEAETNQRVAQTVKTLDVNDEVKQAATTLAGLSK